LLIWPGDIGAGTSGASNGAAGEVVAVRIEVVHYDRLSTIKEIRMARKTIFVSDFSQKEIPDDKQAVQVVLRYADGRRGQIVADAHVDDDIVKQIAQRGTQQARRGRRPKAQSAS
jgi:hypothetical protein